MTAASSADTTISVVVPSYRRPDDLARCLAALRRQDLPPSEIVVVHRPDDGDTRAVVEAFPGIKRVEVDVPGQVAALHAGAAASTGDIVAFTDDDAVPHRDWCRRLADAFRSADIAAVGGRDIVHHGPVVESGRHRRVGLVTPLGRVVGHHHLGAGRARDVHHLKGANMAVRRRYLWFAVGLRGQGAQVANDLAMSLAARRSGTRLVYDPTILVDHHPAPRFDDDGRLARSIGARTDAAFNQSYVLFSLRPDLRRRRLAYVVLCGDRDNGGLVRSAVGLLRGERELRGTLGPLVRAHMEAWRLARTSPLHLVPADGAASTVVHRTEPTIPT
ncbi:MAG TPA: glycosyltransferase family 2 protein [Acidimicrobiales bacterium]|nr:glycosyltransferase family 2 protein [Acidimicrobiales bacterium]